MRRILLCLLAALAAPAGAWADQVGGSGAAVAAKPTPVTAQATLIVGTASVALSTASFTLGAWDNTKTLNLHNSVNSPGNVYLNLAGTACVAGSLATNGSEIPINGDSSPDQGIKLNGVTPTICADNANTPISFVLR